MMHDLLIENGLIVDGTGAPGASGNVTVGASGNVTVGGSRITGVGPVGGPAKRRIDATGLVVCPGFIDIHTHYDAQLCWDKVLSSSTEHGVTSVVTGNCGIGIAPCRTADRRDVALDLMAVEGISFEVLDAGIQWNFNSFTEYMASISKGGVGPNLGMMVPLSTLRRFVMGPAALERAATADECKAICAELRAAMEGGAIGFSASLVSRQVGYGGRPLASLLASREELRAYCRLLRGMARGIIQVNVASQISRISAQELETLNLLIDESARPVTWSGAVIRRDTPQDIDTLLDTVASLTRSGHFPQSTVRALYASINLRSPVLFADVAVVRNTLNKPVDELMKIYADPEFRREFKRDILHGGPKVFGVAFIDCEIHTTGKPALQGLLRRTVREIAAERGADPFDVFFDLAIEDDLEMTFVGAGANADKERMRTHITDPRIILGMADGGAHYDMLFEAGFPTYLLGYWVREQKAITLEHAIKRMTSEPADFLKVSDRGRLQVGNAADITIFDLATVGSSEKPSEIRHDLPAGGLRFYSKATGIRHVIVNGTPLFENGECSGELAGQFIHC